MSATPTTTGAAAPPRRLAAAAVLALAVGAAGCESWFTEPERDEVSPGEIVDLGFAAGSRDTLTRNGSDRTTLEARIPAEASSPTVVFTTTAGAFVLTGINTITVRATKDTATTPDTLIVARATLRADTSTERDTVAYITASVGGFSDTATVVLRKP